uniref:Uncharacterized protein n=1 Tax=Helianthus annuus TaxID=4232 RepID=A0A251V8D7_HELAN
MKILKGRAFSDLEYNCQAVSKVVPDQYDESSITMCTLQMHRRCTVYRRLDCC